MPAHLQEGTEYQTGQPAFPSSQSQPGRLITTGTQANQPGYHLPPAMTIGSQATLPSNQLEPSAPINSPQAQFYYQENEQQSHGYLPPMPNYEQGYQTEQPGQPGHRPGFTEQGVFSPHEVQSDDQEFPPPPPPELLAFPTDLPSDASIDSGVEVYDNIGAKLKARVDEEGIKTPLQQMLARERNIASTEATQAPYGAQIDTLTGKDRCIL